MKTIKCIYYSPHTNEENNKYKLTYIQVHKLQQSSSNIIWNWVGQLQFIVIHLVHKQCGCYYHTNAIRTGLRVPIQVEHHKHLISIPVHVVKSGYDEKRLTKQNHSTALLNTDRQCELLNKTPTYKDTFLHNLSTHPKEFNLAACTGDGQK